jgi:hypothetical protein
LVFGEWGENPREELDNSRLDPSVEPPDPVERLRELVRVRVRRRRRQVRSTEARQEQRKEQVQDLSGGVKRKFFLLMIELVGMGTLTK